MPHKTLAHTWWLVVVLVFSIATYPIFHPAYAQEEQFGEPFDNYVQQTLQAWNAPGVLIVAVRDGKVAMMRGYGSRVWGEQRPIDENTLVQIASHTKAVTSTAIAILVDAGKLSWDDSVQKFIPEFELADPYAASHMNVRDLIAHRCVKDAPAESRISREAKL